MTNKQHNFEDQHGFEGQHSFETALNEDATWAAFLYLTDELSVEQIDLFEDQLSHRQDLQQALIETTRQLAGVAATATQSASQAVSVSVAPAGSTVTQQQPIQTWHMKAACVVVGLAACIVIAILSSGDAPPSNQVVQTQETKPAERDLEPTADMLQAWIDIQPEVTVESDDIVETPSDLSVPDWMLTAVLLEVEDQGQPNDPSFPPHHSDQGSDRI